MKRLLALLLCLSLLLPVFALAEDDEEDIDFNELIEEDVDLDEDGNIVDNGNSQVEYELTEEGLAAMADAFEIDESVDPSELELNQNLPDDVINILLLGLDVRGTSEKKLLKDQDQYAKRADVQMILSVNTFDGSIKLTSIARNTCVDIPDRVNDTSIANSYGHAIYKNGKYSSWVDTPDNCMHTVNRNFEMNIQYYVAINFYGVASIIEYLGGADVELTKQEASAINTYLSMGTIRDKNGKLLSHGKEIARTYDDKKGNREKLEKKDGVQHLDGIQALMYGRLRSIDNDFNRTSRTRKLLSSLLTPTVDKIKNGELKIDKLLPECGQYFKTNMNMQTMMELVNAVMRSDIVKTMDLSDSLIEEFRIPEDGTYSYGEDSTGSSVVKLNNKQATTESLHEFIYGAYYPAN
ncbi:MAG: LCP family protein [Clostridia bacterium]|nr:LCP family protein [Clostridia bacterium]